MIKHIILWKVKDIPGKKEAIASAKKSLEALVGKIDGLVSLHVITGSLSSSSADMMLDSTFESEAALNAYKTNPLHVAAADGFVRPIADVRLCIDYDEKA